MLPHHDKLVFRRRPSYIVSFKIKVGDRSHNVYYRLKYTGLFNYWFQVRFLALTFAVERIPLINNALFSTQLRNSDSLLLPLVPKSWGYETFLRECKEGSQISPRIPKKGRDAEAHFCQLRTMALGVVDQE